MGHIFGLYLSRVKLIIFFIYNTVGALNKSYLEDYIWVARYVKPHEDFSLWGDI